MIDWYSIRQTIALGGVIIAPIFMCMAMFSSLLIGELFFGFSGLSILTSIILCLINMHSVKETEEEQVSLLKQMVKEGTIKQYLKDAGY